MVKDIRRREFLLGLAAAPLALGGESILAAPAPRRELALVTADTQSEVFVVDLARRRVVSRIATPPGPRSIETVGAGRRLALICHTKAGTISIVDGQTLRLRAVIRGFKEPRYTAAHPDGRHAFVTDSGLGQVVVVDVLRGRIVGRIAVGGPARHITLDAAGERLWTALGTKAVQIAVLDTRRPAAPARVATWRARDLAHDVVVAPDGSSVWITSGSERRFAIHDVETGRIRAVRAADDPPQHVAFNGALGYVASGDSGTLRVHLSSDGAPRANAPLPLGSYNITTASGLVLSPSLSRGTLSLHALSGRPITRVKVAPVAHDACVVAGA